MKRLYRLEGDRIIAGVCAGLGEHFDIDPVIIRLLFLLSVIFGGFGVLAYLILWVLVPLKNGSKKLPGPRVRLHRSAADRKIAGIGGGLGDYFALDPVFFRAGFVVLAFMGGFGILLYLVLWLLVPLAPSAEPGRIVES